MQSIFSAFRPRAARAHGKTIGFIAAAIAAGPAFAQGALSYQCDYGDLERRVEIHAEPGMTVPCEVHYHKDAEAPGERQILWSASNDAGYCERKTEEFIARLRDWGWSCVEQATAAAYEADAGATGPVQPQESPAPPQGTVDTSKPVEESEPGESSGP